MKNLFFVDVRFPPIFFPTYLFKSYLWRPSKFPQNLDRVWRVDFEQFGPQKC